MQDTLNIQRTCSVLFLRTKSWFNSHIFGLDRFFRTVYRGEFLNRSRHGTLNLRLGGGGADASSNGAPEQG